VAVSFESPEYTADVDGMGTLRILEAIRILGLEKKTRYFRPTEVETLLGDPSKAKQKLGWVPEITAQQMCAEMVAPDLAEAKKHALLKKHGYQVNVSVE